MNYKILDLAQKDEWNHYLSKLPIEQQDIYYTPEYYSLYENYGDGKAKCFVFEDEGDIALYPFLINSVNELCYDLDEDFNDIRGAYGYNGVVTSTYSEKFIEIFYKIFNEFCCDLKIIAEFTRFNPILKNENFSKSTYNLIHDRTTVYIDLTRNIDEIRNDFTSSTRRAINKAKKNKLYPIIFEKIFPFKDKFIEIYYETMKRVNSNSYLYFNEKYFNNLFNLNHIIQFVIEFNEKPIASSICFYSKNYFHYHLGASITEYLNYRPNDLLFEEMIKYAKLKNCKSIHLGGGSSLDKKDSLFKFKSNFSKDSLDFYIGGKIHNKKVYNEVMRQWEEKNPKHEEMSKNMFLRYRNLRK